VDAEERRETGGRASREQKRAAAAAAHQEVIMWLSAPDRLARAALGRRLLVWNSEREREREREQREKSNLKGDAAIWPGGGQELITIEIDDSLRDTHTYPLSFPPKVLQRRKTTKPAAVVYIQDKS
jgi:hypothetical protein